MATASVMTVRDTIEAPPFVENRRDTRTRTRPCEIDLSYPQTASRASRFIGGTGGAFER